MINNWPKIMINNGFMAYYNITNGRSSILVYHFLQHACFGTASTSDVTSQLNSRERGGALDTKNPDPYYSECSKILELKNFESIKFRQLRHWLVWRYLIFHLLVT